MGAPAESAFRGKHAKSDTEVQYGSTRMTAVQYFVYLKTQPLAALLAYGYSSLAAWNEWAITYTDRILGTPP